MGRLIAHDDNGSGRGVPQSVPDATKAGGLYLGVNDTKQTVGRVQDRLEVAIFEAL